MIVSDVAEIPDVTELVDKQCIRVTYDPFEIHLSFEDEIWLAVSCKITLNIADNIWQFSADEGEYLTRDIPIYKCVGLNVTDITNRDGKLSIILGAVRMDIEPDMPGTESLSFNSKKNGSTIVNLP